MDTLGVVQHHDAVTGTAKTKVSQDYRWKIFEAMKINNLLYAKLIDEAARTYAEIGS